MNQVRCWLGILTSAFLTAKPEDDCLAINRGSNIVFKGNTCSGGHGISVVCRSSRDVIVNFLDINHCRDLSTLA
jgi:hypothetical protein